MQRFYKTAAIILALVPAVILSVMTGCGPDTELGGVELINAVPDTRITGTPPYLRETDFIVSFHWTGSDPDGRIRGFQWKMSSNGDDGISIRDTLTIDPVTGDTLNPWFFTQVTDTTFVVTADSSGFEGDVILPEELQRFYQPHTLFVRAVDDAGAVDPSPAMLTFTATTIAPSIRLTSPPSLAGTYREARSVPPSFIVGWTGGDQDFELNTPTRVRYLLRTAQYTNDLGNDVYLTSEYDYIQYGQDLVRFDDSRWSDWLPYYGDPARRTASFEKQQRDAQGNLIYYLFAIQAQDTAGAVSLDRSYGRTVHNFRIDDTQRPLLVLRERYLGTERYAGQFGRFANDIAQNQPLQFEWSASADSYGGIITGYRYGWDVEDLDDPNDPGWNGQFGLSDSHRATDLTTFSSSQHVLTVECRDNSGLFTRVNYFLDVVPVPESEDQEPLILIDDVRDHSSNGWNNAQGTTAYDNDIQRDRFWEDMLASAGGVVGFNSDRDVIDDFVNGGTWGYRDVVGYKAVLWNAKRNPETYIARNFQPGLYQPDDEDEPPIPIEAYVWLETYQNNVGNLLLAGSGVLQNFHYNSPRGLSWLYPVIYDNDEGPFGCIGGNTRAMSFGTRREADGELTILGRLQYPYRALGVAVSDMNSPQDWYYSPSVCGRRTDRKVRCMGTKAIVLDPEFKERHVSAGAFSDTIYVWSTIDWADDIDGIPSELTAYNFGQDDEFYDVNITARTTNWVPQAMPDGSRAVEPMWRVYPRYNWILDRHHASGDTDYQYDTTTMPCGQFALDPATGRTINDGVAVGVFTYRTVNSKPSGKADVIWGFSPSMFDRTEMKRAVRWVLGEHFGLQMAP